jgi:hypothetical protein
LSRTLYDAARSPTKHWLALPGADHNDLELLAGDRLIDAIDRFLTAVLAEVPPED